ncbi:hypothetical protein ACVU7I_03485 [Patulibacter sp. S7RM1-6]
MGEGNAAKVSRWVESRAVALLTAVPSSPLELLLASGRARPARGDLRHLPAPAPGPSATDDLRAMRAAERF